MHPNDGRVVSNFVVQALTGKPITIYGDGTQTRSFCYVDDLIVGLIGLMESSDGTTGPMNLGNPDEYRIVELASAIVELANSPSKIEFKPLPSDDPTQRQPNIQQARDILGWTPTVPLREGLQKTIAYFEHLLTARGRPITAAVPRVST
jgi:UDP-glucuronate decarboxylase